MIIAKDTSATPNGGYTRSGGGLTATTKREPVLEALRHRIADSALRHI
jgi:hypothetical protein